MPPVILRDDHHARTENALRHAAAYLEHGVDKVVILDIDLHHGNGTQEIVWRLNALAHKQSQALAAKKNASPRKGSPKKPTVPPEEPRPPLQLFYGSLHDVNSYREPVCLCCSRPNMAC